MATIEESYDRVTNAIGNPYSFCEIKFRRLFGGEYEARVGRYPEARGATIEEAVEAAVTKAIVTIEAQKAEEAAKAPPVVEVDPTDDLPYATPVELYRAFRAGEKFDLRYHGKVFQVTSMEPRERVVYVAPPGMPVKVFPNGRSAEGSATAAGPHPTIRLVRRPAEAA